MKRILILLFAAISILGCQSPRFATTATTTGTLPPPDKKPCEPSITKEMEVRPATIKATVVQKHEETYTTPECPRDMRMVWPSRRELELAINSDKWNSHWDEDHTTCIPDSLFNMKGQSK